MSLFDYNPIFAEFKALEDNTVYSVRFKASTDSRKSVEKKKNKPKEDSDKSTQVA